MGRNTDEWKAKRKQFEKMQYRGITVKCGTKCVNCGSTEHVEYHHIVPLSNGGTNALSNIVPLCQKCHFAAHNKKLKNAYKTGRPKVKKPDNFDEVAEAYQNGELTWYQACKRTNLSKNSFYKILRKCGYKSEDKKQSEHHPNLRKWMKEQEESND